MAGTSDARKASESLTPISRGDTRLAATITSGRSAWTSAREKAPRTLPSATRTASTRPASGSSRRADSTRWARTSVSVSDSSRCPDAMRPSASSTWFSMIPLWTRASRPEQSRCGWAFSSEGRPWVAHRVCPMPAVAPAGALSARLARLSRDRVPLAARDRHIEPGPAPTRANPAESYPRYSRRASPSSSTPSTRWPSAWPSAGPVVIPMMPHMPREATVPAPSGGCSGPDRASGRHRVG